MARRWYSTHEVAVRLDITEARVRRIAAALGVGARVGRTWVFTEEDLEALRTRPDRRRRQNDNAATPEDDGA